jgi:hypothetical protein
METGTPTQAGRSHFCKNNQIFHMFFPFLLPNTTRNGIETKQKEKRKRTLKEILTGLLAASLFEAIKQIVAWLR